MIDDKRNSKRRQFSILLFRTHIRCCVIVQTSFWLDLLFNMSLISDSPEKWLETEKKIVSRDHATILECFSQWNKSPKRKYEYTYEGDVFRWWNLFLEQIKLQIGK